jgi:5-methyltetrahydropteroyltriglutamate--homocysteine methyltransferase
LASGGYDPVAERVFNIDGIDVFLMEYDSPRAGSFSPLRHLPKGKVVVLGLISSKTATLEDKAQVQTRIDQAAKVVPLDQLGVGPQCGFATNLSGNPLTEADERAKLKLVVGDRSRGMGRLTVTPGFHRILGGRPQRIAYGCCRGTSRP